MPTNIPAGGYLAQQLWSSAVTLFTEAQCLCPVLYRKGDDGVISVEDRQDVKDMGDRGSSVQFWYGDRRRGQDIAPKALGATQFGQSAPQRPIYSQSLNMQAQELATTGWVNMEIGQTYTNVPLERKELRDCGAEAAELICRSIYYHLGGLTAYNSTGTLWTVSPCGNAVTELDAKHRFFMGGQTTDAGVAGDANAILTLESLELIITKLRDPLLGRDLPDGARPDALGRVVRLSGGPGGQRAAPAALHHEPLHVPHPGRDPGRQGRRQGRRPS